MRPPGKRTNLIAERLETRWLLSSIPFVITLIGDSVTVGMDEEDAAIRAEPARVSFRPSLWEKANRAFDDVDFEFVGASDYNPTSLPLQAMGHSAFRGFPSNLFFVAHDDPNVGSDGNRPANTDPQSADGWATFDADAALIMLGVNDVILGRPVDALQSGLRQIIEELRADNASIDILLATLLPIEDSRPNANAISKANEMIVDLVHADASAGWKGSLEQSPIHIVDHSESRNGAIPYDWRVHSVDGVHPNVAGEELLAINWWSVLEPLVAKATAKTVEVPPQAKPTQETPGMPPERQTAEPSSRRSRGADSARPTNEVIELPRVTLSIEDPRIRESDSARVTFSRSSDNLSGDLILAVRFDGTADESDFRVAADELVIPDGIATVTLDILVLQDHLTEEPETLAIQIDERDTYTVDTKSILLTFLDDDSSNNVSPRSAPSPSSGEPVISRRSRRIIRGLLSVE